MCFIKNIFCVAYIPPSNSKWLFIKGDPFELLNSFISENSKIGKVIFCEDLHARTKTIADFIENEENDESFFTTMTL